MSNKMDIEIEELSIIFNNKILEIEKKYKNEFKVLAITREMCFGEELKKFDSQPKVRLRIVYP